MNRLLNGGFGDFVKHNTGGSIYREPEFVANVPGDGLAFAVVVSCKEDVFWGVFSDDFPDFGDVVGLFFNEGVGWMEGVFGVDIGEACNLSKVTFGRDALVAGTEILFDLGAFGWALYNKECVFRHGFT